MADGERIFERMQRTKAGWRWSDFDAVYREFGFDCEEGRDHTLYIHPEYPGLRAEVKRHPGEFPPGYAQRAVKLIRQLKQLKAAETAEQTAEEETDNDAN